MSSHHDRNPPKPSRYSRTVGALLALHAGDSLGATYEFESHSDIRSKHRGPNASFPRRIVGGGPFQWKAGSATDDTDMTRAVLLAYHDVLTPSSSSASPSPRDVVFRSAEYFEQWYFAVPSWPGRKRDSRPPDVGGATEQGLQEFMLTRDPAKSGCPQGFAGNGSLMRCLPTGLFQHDRMKLLEESMGISAVTHDDHRCKVSCASYNCMVNALVIRGSSPQEAVAAGLQAAKILEGGKTTGPVYAAIELGRRTSLSRIADEGPHPSMYPGRCSGFVLETLSLAVAALMDPRKLEDVLVDVVRVGKDTDTNAAVAGGLLGARDGEEAVPEEWKKILQFSSEFRQLASDIIRVQSDKSHKTHHK